MVGKRRGNLHKALDVKSIAALIRKRKAGRHFDGDGLHLWIKPAGTASWVWRGIVKGLGPKEIGLGSAIGNGSVSLAEARDKAANFRRLARSGVDPKERERQRAARSVLTLGEAAILVHGEHLKRDPRKHGWKNEKHKRQWLASLQVPALAELNRKRVDLVETPDVQTALGPLYAETPETAKRVTQRLRSIFDWAIAAGQRTTANPVGPVLMAWARTFRKKVQHFRAMSYEDVPAFLTRLRP